MMDDVEKLEKQDLNGYIQALENKVNELALELDTVQQDKEQLFNSYIDSLHKLYNIGG